MNDSVLNEDYVQGELNEWINFHTDLLTIKSYGAADRPCLPYIMTDLVSVRAIRQFEQRFDYDDLDSQNVAGEFDVQVQTVYETEWMFTINVYGDNPTSPLRRLHSIYRIPRAQDILRPKLIVHDVGIINYLPEFINNEWEKRAHCYITLRGLVREGIVVEPITEASFVISRQ